MPSHLTTGKRPRLRTGLRKATKWSGAAITLTLLAVWIGSCWYVGDWVPANHSWFFVSGGRVTIMTPKSPGSAGVPGDFHVRRIPAPLAWSVDRGYASAQGNWTVVAVPLWPAVLIALVTTALVWRADAAYRRRSRVGLCPSCGYDRAGLAPSNLCPECGGPAPEPRADAPAHSAQHPASKTAT